MAEGTSPTNKLYTKVGGLLAALSLWIALDKGDMAALDETTNAPVSEATESGVARAAATVTNPQTTVIGDTLQAYKSFAVNATVALTGAHVMSAAAVGDDYQWHRWAATANVIAGDTVNETLKIQSKLGA